MNRCFAFASRNSKELLRDPLTLVFGMGLPLILLLFISLLQRSIAGANNAFELSNFAPGMAVFSFAFVSLFSGMLISGDRCSSFLMRVFASPLTAADYIFGYMLPLVPLALLQACVCFGAAFLLGLDFTWNVFIALLTLIPIALMFAGFGLLIGTVLSDKQLGGVFTIFVNIATWLSGTWFDIRLIGGAFETIADLLPFIHAVEATRAALSGEFSAILPHLWVVAVYAAAMFAAAILLFRKKMRG